MRAARTGWAGSMVVGLGAAAALVLLGGGAPAPMILSDPVDASNASFVNWESTQAHPMDITPDGSTLLVCNTADNRLEVFSITTGTPVLVSEIFAGLDPVSVRARSNSEAWVVNAISDSVSIVNLQTRNVVATLQCKNEPGDVVFAGTPQRAFVTCAQANVVQVFDPANLSAAPTDIAIAGEAPRALAVSTDGQKVYAAIFNSGNASTILGGGATSGAGRALGFPPNVVSDGAGPYAGTNPPPNSGAAFSPAIAGGLPVPPAVGLIVKKNGSGQWMDDNNHDWSGQVSGPAIGGTGVNASGRVPNWNLPDRDLAVIDASSLGVTYATGLMNICMGLGVNPATAEVAVIGTDATNEVRFEPNVKGTFVRVEMARVNPTTLAKTVADLNPHLDYLSRTIAQSERDKSIGDPRNIVFNASGTKAYVCGMGSNNVIVINASGGRAGLAPTIPVGEGPTGLALDEARGRLYVLNRFAGSISIVSTASESVVGTLNLFDPTPTLIKTGRKHLFDTRKNSGLGQASCASCHVDAKMDRLAWDLGDPTGAMKQVTGQNLGFGLPGLRAGQTSPAFAPWHPMKGPMTTQTLQDIIGKEPHHWRGDRAGLEEFNGAFIGLLGDDTNLTTTEMQEFEDYLATVTFPPNPFRNFDNTLPTSLPLPGHRSVGTFAASGGKPAGAPLDPGNAVNGLALYKGDPNFGRRLDAGAFACVTCHTLPTGAGTDMQLVGATYQPFPVGPNGEHHAALVSTDGSTNISIKIPQIRNAYLKVGFDATQTDNTSGFGYLHDGSIDSIARFITEPVFTLASDQEVSDMVAFILCMSGSDLPSGAVNTPLSPPGLASKDVPAAVGRQTTLVSASNAGAAQLALINSMVSLAQASKVGLIVKGVVNNEQRGWAYVPSSSVFQSDRAGETRTLAALEALAQPGSELTFTVVPLGCETRMGIDRDENGVLDRNQSDAACYANCDGSLNAPVLTAADFTCFLQKFRAGDPSANCDGNVTPPILSAADFTCFLQKFRAGCP